MAVHVSTRSAFAPGRGRGGRGGGRFWCSFEIAALTAPTVASASSHCMHKLVNSSLGALARASPASATAPPFAPRASGQRRRRRRLAMPRQAPRQPQPQPRVAASHPDPLPHQRPQPAGGVAGGTSTCGGEEAATSDGLGGDEWGWPVLGSRCRDRRQSR